MLGTHEFGEIRQLIRLVQRTGIGEIEVSSGGRSVRISAWGPAHGPVSPAMMPAPVVAASPVPAGGASAPAAEAPGKPDAYVAIPSPMVGTFYRAPAPDADPYVELGSMVEVGQTVCIVEAMKLMNEIESEVRGKIVKVLVENAQPVEFGQPLYLVDPS